MNLLDRIVAERRASIAREREQRGRGWSAAGIGSSGSGDEGAALPGKVAEGGDARTDQIPVWIGESGEVRPSTVAPRSLAGALRAPGRRIIAEIKRRSPSAGVIRDPLDPATIASVYEECGAAALSVLTEPRFFGGSDSDLSAARAAVRLPVLRKDFVLDAAMLEESRAIGADAALLLASVLTPAELAALVGAARSAGLETLVEVSDDGQLDAALAAGAEIIGVNSRDLRDFTIDPKRAVRLAKRIPDHVVRVAESGIHSRDDVARLEDAGYRAFLVGESLLRAPDPGARLLELLR